MVLREKAQCCGITSLIGLMGNREYDRNEGKIDNTNSRYRNESWIIKVLKWKKYWTKVDRCQSRDFGADPKIRNLLVVQPNMYRILLCASLHEILTVSLSSGPKNDRAGADEASVWLLRPFTMCSDERNHDALTVHYSIFENDRETYPSLEMKWLWGKILIWWEPAFIGLWSAVVAVLF